MILCVGEILIDLFIDDNKRLSLPGGAPFNVCANINSFSSKCGFFGSCMNRLATPTTCAMSGRVKVG